MNIILKIPYAQIYFTFLHFITTLTLLDSIGWFLYPSHIVQDNVLYSRTPFRAKVATVLLYHSYFWRYISSLIQWKVKMTTYFTFLPHCAQKCIPYGCPTPDLKTTAILHVELLWKNLKLMFAFKKITKSSVRKSSICNVRRSNSVNMHWLAQVNYVISECNKIRFC